MHSIKSFEWNNSDLCEWNKQFFLFCTDIDEQNRDEHWTILLYKLNFERLNPVKYCDISGEKRKRRRKKIEIMLFTIWLKWSEICSMLSVYNIIYHVLILVKQFKWKEISIWLKNRFVL